MLLGIISALSALTAFLICVGADGFQSFSWLWILPAGFFGAFLALVILWVILLLIMSAFVDVKKPQEKDNRLYPRGLRKFPRMAALCWCATT